LDYKIQEQDGPAREGDAGNKETRNYVERGTRERKKERGKDRKFWGDMDEKRT